MLHLPNAPVGRPVQFRPHSSGFRPKPRPTYEDPRLSRGESAGGQGSLPNNSYLRNLRTGSFRQSCPTVADAYDKSVLSSTF